MSEINETVEYILDALELDEFTPSQIAAVLNGAIEILGLERSSVRTQMMYNYSSNGMIVKSAPRGTNGDHRYNRNEVQEFAIKFLNGNVRSGANIKSLINEIVQNRTAK